MSPATDNDRDTDTAPKPVVTSDAPVMLIGAGPVAAEDISTVRKLSGPIVAADGGAEAVLRAGLTPAAVIGDLDSLAAEVRARLDREIVHEIAAQDSTDFEKCLLRIVAPLVLAVGFSRGRMDHLMAVLGGLARHPGRRCVLIGPEDVAVTLPPRLDLALPPGCTVSLFPFAPVTVDSTGLVWPTGGIAFRPDGPVGTSNRADGPVALRAAAPGMILFLPRAELPRLLDGLADAPGW